MLQSLGKQNRRDFHPGIGDPVSLRGCIEHWLRLCLGSELVNVQVEKDHSLGNSKLFHLTKLIIQFLKS